MKIISSAMLCWRAGTSRGDEKQLIDLQFGVALEIVEDQ